jgi:hypothetical protein
MPVITADRLGLKTVPDALGHAQFIGSIAARLREVLKQPLRCSAQLGDVLLGSLGDRRSGLARMFLFEQAEVAHYGLKQKSTAHHNLLRFIACGWLLDAGTSSIDHIAPIA